ADVALREKVAFPPEKMPDAIRQLEALDRVEEVVIVSTCNRTELYLQLDMGESAGPELDAPLDARLQDVQQRALLHWLGAYHGLAIEKLQNSAYFFWREDVVRHLMRVACG